MENNMENQPSTPSGSVPQQGMPSQKAQSWGAFISMIIIVLMIIVGAFYAWGKRIAKQQNPIVPTLSEEQY